MKGTRRGGVLYRWDWESLEFTKSPTERGMDDCDILWGNVWLETVVMVL
jgi:hypothetical protein